MSIKKRMECKIEQNKHKRKRQDLSSTIHVKSVCPATTLSPWKIYHLLPVKATSSLSLDVGNLLLEKHVPSPGGIQKIW